MPTKNSWNVDKLLDDGGSPDVLLVKIVPLKSDANLKAVSDSSDAVADTCFAISGMREPAAEDAESGIRREKWNKKIEFLLSCVALSVGFGNVWRFPYTALENGGGAFLIPYLIVLFVVGRPLYYLEMVMGQFSSRGCVKVFDVSPLMRGVGVGQTITMFTIVGYYAAVLAIAVRYFVASFEDPLPWTKCQLSWEGCISSNFVEKAHYENETGPKTVSAQLYFRKTVIQMAPDLENGLGIPDWRLALCLLACWICITAMLIKGIKSSGKASYFLAIFPYVILMILLVRACTLEGAFNGIGYFFKPDFSALLKPTVWYAAVSQCFFSLTIGLGAVIVFSSFNSFSNNIYRDAMIISWLDTFTSIISGIIVFGVVGNLAHVTGRDVKDLKNLGGPSLTFITYPDAIAKMNFAPNFFAVLFFLMFILLGLGSNMGIVQTILTSIRDRYPQVQTWKVVLVIAVTGFSCGLVYLTPAGLYVLEVVEFYGVTYASLTLVILEAVTFFSLTIGLGAVIVFSSFNSFSNNIYRDAMIISWLDTFTSIISGIIVFGVVGNLAHVTGRDVKDLKNLGGPSLTFITYPDAIAKMNFAPNFFAVLFFLMFILLGLGSNMGIVQTILTSIRDRYPQVQTWKVVLVIAVTGFSCGLVYLTPAGLYVLEVVEFYGVTYASLTLVILEAVTFCWIYGVNRICQDIKFMLDIQTGLFWRICWGLITPTCIIAVFILQFFKQTDAVPTGYKVFGWCLYGFTTLVQIVSWGSCAIRKQSEKLKLPARIVQASQPTEDWGPESISLKKEYDVVMRRYRESYNDGSNIMKRTYQKIFQ